MKIELRDIKKQYAGKEVLHGINVTFEKGITGVLGKNGAGKTTLLKIMSSLVLPTSGEILVDNEVLKKMEWSFEEKLDIYLKISQHIHFLLFMSLWTIWQLWQK